eukprot:PITA_27367
MSGSEAEATMENPCDEAKMENPCGDLDGLRDELPSTDDTNVGVPETRTNIGIDEMLETWAGEFGRWQLKHFVLASFAWTLMALQTMVIIFADSQPDWHCNKQKVPDDSHSMQRGLEFCSPTVSICSIDRASWDWDGSRGISTVSEWGLFCNEKYKVGLVQSAFFVGSLIGAGLFGRLSDSSLGRKGVLNLACAGNAILGFLTAMSPNFWVYLILRLLTGITCGGVGLSSFVLATEPVGPPRRGPVGMSAFYFYSFGIGLLSALAYFSDTWRLLYIVTSTPSALYCLFVLPFLWESPRWFLVKARLEEAMEVMRSIAAENSKLIPAGVSLALDRDQKDATDVGESPGSLMDVFKSPVTRRRMIAMAWIWLACAMVYYGLNLNVGNLGTNLYLSVFLNGIAELPAYSLTAIMVDKFERRAMLIFLMLLSGLSCLLASSTSVLVEILGSNPMENRGTGVSRKVVSGVKLACSLVGIFGAAGMYNLVYVYTCELFPTVVRNAALGLASQTGKIGAIVAPLVLVTGNVNSALPFFIIGISGIVGGVLAFMLPRTLNRHLAETMAAFKAEIPPTGNDLI